MRAPSSLHTCVIGRVGCATGLNVTRQYSSARRRQASPKHDRNARRYWRWRAARSAGSEGTLAPLVGTLPGISAP